MITVRNIHKSFGIQLLFENASLQINAGDRYALIGPNGSGKSTLMKMLLGEEEPDGGEIQFKSGILTGYLPQENAPLVETTILEEALSHHADPDGKVTAKAKTILMGLGFKITDFDRKVNTLSGGWAMRVAMARLLIQEPDLLMLDEPTNHLDLESLLWFQDYLTYYRGAIFLISHDRQFINTVCTAIVSVQNHILKPYYGNYEYFLNERAAEKERLITAYNAQQKEIKETEDFISRNRARVSTANRAQSAIKRLEKMERIELPAESKKIKIRFPQPERTGVRALSLKNLHKSYGPLKVYCGLNFDLERGQNMAFVGHNGEGKSTLLNILAGTIPFDSGERILGLNVI
ncbi:MAG: ABC-F family ATP-binding cassette domain-containing protein, partial [Elusimicrobia bacterium]|nr:ABC-F family ATP-binding cassette domain-containing protein [Elusimicrobiota bacterium]